MAVDEQQVQAADVMEDLDDVLGEIEGLVEEGAGAPEEQTDQTEALAAEEAAAEEADGDTAPDESAAKEDAEPVADEGAAGADEQQGPAEALVAMANSPPADADAPDAEPEAEAEAEAPAAEEPTPKPVAAKPAIGSKPGFVVAKAVAPLAAPAPARKGIVMAVKKAAPGAAAAAAPAPAAARPAPAAAAARAAPAPKAAAVSKTGVAAKPAAATAADAKPGAAGPTASKTAKAVVAVAPKKVIAARVVVVAEDDEAGDAPAGAPAGDAAKPAPKKAPAAKPAAAPAAAKKGPVMVTAAKPKLSGFTLFLSERRPQLMEEEGLDSTKATVRANQEWAALSADDKAACTARAAEQAAAEAAAPAITPAPAVKKAPVSKEPKPPKEAKEPKTAKEPKAVKEPKAPKAPKDDGPKFMTPYMLFASEERAGIVAANPEAGFGDIGKLMGAAWKEMGEEARAEYKARAEALNEANGLTGPQRKPKAEKPAKEPKPAKTPKGKKAKASVDCGEEGGEDGLAAADAGLEVDGDPMDVDQPHSSKKGKSKKGRRGSSGTKRPAEGEAGSCEPDSDDEEIEERCGCDWEANPAEAILSRTANGSHYLVKRRGLGLDEYGMVDARAVKRQRLAASGLEGAEGEEAAPLPVDVDMVDEFDSFERNFWASVQDRAGNKDLDLDDLGEHSPLELCYFLGKLREDNMALGRRTKMGGRDKDFMITVPALRLSLAVQRVVVLERQRADRAEAALVEAEARLAAYEGEEVAA